MGENSLVDPVLNLEFTLDIIQFLAKHNVGLMNSLVHNLCKELTFKVTIHVNDERLGSLGFGVKCCAHSPDFYAIIARETRSRRFAVDCPDAL